MNLVLEYFKNDRNANFGSWPDLAIGLVRTINKTNSFYSAANTWFEKNHQTKVLRSEISHHRRFLATFIFVAGYPPHLGFKRIVKGTIKKSNWEDIIENPKRELQEYLLEYRHNFSPIEKTLTKENTEGYDSIVELLHILARLKTYLVENEKKEELIRKFAKDNHYPYNKIKLVFDSYKDILEISGKKERSSSNLIFDYFIDYSHNPPFLVLVSNIKTTKGVTLSKRISPVSQPKLAFTTKSVGSKNLSLSIETDQSGSKIKSKFISKVMFPILHLDYTLIDFKVFLSGLQENGKSIQQEIYSLKRNFDFIIFNKETGREIQLIGKALKKGITYFIIPLSVQVFQSLNVLAETNKAILTSIQGNMPIFEITEEKPFTIGEEVFYFTEKPVSIVMEEQTIMESFFGKYSYFSRNIKCYINTKAVIKKIYIAEKYDEFEKEKEVCTVKNDAFYIKNLPANSYNIIVHSKDYKRKIPFKILPIKEFKLNYETIECELLHNHYLKTKAIKSNKIYQNNKNVYKLHLEKNKTNKDIIWFLREKKKLVIADFEYIHSDALELYINNRKVNNNSKQNIRSVSLDSYISFHINSGKKTKYIIAIEYSGFGYSFPMVEKFSIDTEYQDRFSLASSIQYVRSHTIQKVEYTIINNEESVFSFSFFENELPLFSDGGNRIYSEPDGLFNGFIVFDLLQLWKKPLIMQSLPLKLPTSGLYQIYGFILNNSSSFVSNITDPKKKAKVLKYDELVKETCSYSKPVIISKCNEHILADESDTLKRFLFEIYDNINSNKYICENENTDFFNDFISIISNKNSARRLSAIFEILDEFPRKYDFIVYSFLPVLFPLIATWWELARDFDNRDMHFSALEHDKELLLDDYFLMEHNRFSWDFIRKKHIHILSKNNLLPLLNRDEMNIFSKLCAAYEDGKYLKQMSWVLMFWFYEYCKIHDLKKELNEFESIIHLIPNNPYTIWVSSENNLLPVAGNTNEAILDDFEHFVFNNTIPLISKHSITEIIDMTRNGSLWSRFQKYLREKPSYKQPYNQLYKTNNNFGIPEKSLWCSFISLYIVHQQLDINSELISIIHLNNDCLSLLLKWLKNSAFTIYSKWYHYWMVIHWEGKANV